MSIKILVKHLVKTYRMEVFGVKILTSFLIISLLSPSKSISFETAIGLTKTIS